MISYTPIKGEPETTFDDLVCYNKVTDKVGKAPTELKGIDRLEEGAGVRWKWFVLLYDFDIGRSFCGTGEEKEC